MSSTNPKVSYENLNDDFYKIIYKDFYIIVHKESGYINGTKLQFAMNSKKPFFKWAGIVSKTGKYYTKGVKMTLPRVAEPGGLPPVGGRAPGGRRPGPGRRRDRPGPGRLRLHADRLQPWRL